MIKTGWNNGGVDGDGVAIRGLFELFAAARGWGGLCGGPRCDPNFIAVEHVPGPSQFVHYASQ